MDIEIHETNTLGEFREVVQLRSPKRMFLEEWDDDVHQIASSCNTESIQVFFMVVVSAVQIDLTYTKMTLQKLETLDASRALRNRKLMRHLITSFVASAAQPLGLTDEVDRKASFAINKTSNPTNLNQSFLLIVRS